jgi:hypothetical protein
MTLQNWNSEDWKVDFPDIYFEGNITKAPIIWKVGQLTKYVLGSIIPDAFKALMNGGELSSLLLCFALIDYLASYYVGRGTGEKAYINFMSRYFPQKYHPYLQSIYGQLRCGLLHNLVAYNPFYRGERINYYISRIPKDHLERLDNNKLNFSIPIFLEDTRRAYIMYSYDMVMKAKDNQELLANFSHRYNKLDGKSSVMVYIPD